MFIALGALAKIFDVSDSYHESLTLHNLKMLHNGTIQ